MSNGEKGSGLPPLFVGVGSAALLVFAGIVLFPAIKSLFDTLVGVVWELGDLLGWETTPFVTMVFNGLPIIFFVGLIIGVIWLVMKAFRGT